MMSALDPLGMPVATDVVPGQRADDPLYVPAITRVREGLGRCGLLYVGDGQMAAVDTRAISTPEAMTTCARCRRASCRPWCWPAIWRRCGRGSRP